jgi:hypothetical protein
MKTSLSILLLLISFASFNVLKAQVKPSIVVLNLETKGVIPDAKTTGNIVRIELEKTKLFDIIDPFDINETIIKQNINIDSCISRSCILSVGKALKTEKILTGIVERIGEKIIITLKIINTESGKTETSHTQEYLNLQNEIQKMLNISVNKLNNLPVDETIVNLLIAYNQPIETPQTQMKNNGPRFGASMLTGDAGKLFTAPKEVGGFDMYPVSFQFGWQHEVQYLSSGNFQGLFEFIGSLGGLESGKLMPSFTLLNGFRMGRQGWEFGIGPTFRFVSKATGYYDENKVWRLGDGYTFTPDKGVVQYPTISRLDSRGNPTLNARLLIAVGRTFKSGYLNIPVNIYTSPSKSGWIYGVSFGFNIYKKPRVQN